MNTNTNLKTENKRSVMGFPFFMFAVVLTNCWIQRYAFHPYALSTRISLVLQL